MSDRDPLEELLETMMETARTCTDPAEMVAMARVLVWVLDGPDVEPAEG